MTTAYPGVCEGIVTHSGVYRPQHDSLLLIEALAKSGLAVGRRVLDLCTGSGVVAIAAARLGASSVTAVDICPRAVRCSSANARSAGVDVDVRRGSLARALALGPYQLVVCNPPYVPVAPGATAGRLVPGVGPVWAWDGGEDGRLVLDPLCESASSLLVRGGAMLLVQSEFSGAQHSLAVLRAAGLKAEIVLWQWIPFGPVLSSQAGWLEQSGRLHHARREEQLVVIRADKP